MFLYAVLLSLFFYCIYDQTKYCNPNSRICNKGRSTKKENISIILDRTDWVNSYKTRINYLTRYYIFSFIIAIFLTASILNSTPTSIIFAQSILITMVILISCNNYFEHHSEKFSRYYIHTNIKTLREKLNLKENKTNLEININNIPETGSEAWNYNDDIKN